LENVPEELDVVLPSAVSDTDDVCTEADTVIELAPEANAIFAPATNDTLDDDAFNAKLVAAGTVGPTIVMELAPLLSVMFAPATRLTLLDVPFKEKFVAVGTAGPITVTAGFVDS
jgi:hypothetical protein